MAGCSIVPSDRGVPVRTAQAQINATTVDQPLASHPVTGIVRFAEMKDGGVRVSGEVKNSSPTAKWAFTSTRMATARVTAPLPVATSTPAA